jgi:hypothetical protein
LLRFWHPIGTETRQGLDVGSSSHGVVGGSDFELADHHNAHGARVDGMA